MTKLIYHKSVTSGNITELYSYQKGILKGYINNPKGVSVPIELSEEEQNERDRENLKRSLHRTVQRLRRTINTNINEWGFERPKFMTLTFKRNILDHETANKEFREFIRRLNRYVFKKQRGLKYTCVVERQTRGAIHFHVIFYNLPYVKYEKLLNLWENGTEQRGLRINAIHDIDNVGAYVLKYVEKDINALKNGQVTKTGKSSKQKHKKLFFQSKGLYKPKEQEFELHEEFDQLEKKLLLGIIEVFETSFENEYVGQMTYKQIKKPLR